MNRPSIYSLQAPGTAMFTLHLYEHLFLRSLFDLLSKNNFPYISLIGNISAQTFNNTILLSIECRDKKSLGIINDYLQHTGSLINLGDSTIKSEINRISAEDGYKYKIQNFDKLVRTSRDLAKNNFKWLSDDLPLKYTEPATPVIDKNISRHFSPSSFRDITINLSIDHPSPNNRVILQASSDLMSELIDNALRSVDGYKQNNAEMIDCSSDDAVIIKTDGLIPNTISDKSLISAVKNQLRNCIKLLNRNQVDDYFSNMQYSGQYYLRLYYELGVCVSPISNTNITNYDNLVDLIKKISVYNITDWPAEENYDKQDGQPER